MNAQQQQIPLEKVLEKYGKACLEREMAFDQIAILQEQISKFQKELETFHKSKKE